MSSGFDLKGFRTEKLKVTQAQMAEAIGIRQDALSRYEDKPDEIPFKVFQAISQRYGVPYNELLDYKRNVPEALDIKNNWLQIKYLQEKIQNYINNVKSNIGDSSSLMMLSNFKNFVYKITMKPKMVFLGRSDSGKSTMINSILGVDKLPTNWTPATSIIVYIKHKDDRPEYIKEDLWIFKNDQNNNYWDDSLLSDEDYTSGLKLAGGDVSMLASYGTGDGEQYKLHEEEIGSAVLFIDSPILKNCDILDVPGFTGGKPSDVRAAQHAGTKADILVYLSQSNSFMGIDDVVYLKGGISHLTSIDNNEEIDEPKLENLFVVATQAHIINNGNQEEINKILDRGSARFYNTLPETFWSERQSSSNESNYTESDLRKRFFSYTTDIKSLRSQFETELKKLIEKLPHILEPKYKKAIGEYKDDKISEVTKKIKYEDALINQYIQLKEQLENNTRDSDRILYELRERRKAILYNIQKHRQKSWEAFECTYRSLINEEALVELMKERDISNKKASKEEFLVYVSSKLDESLKNSILAESKIFTSKVDEYMGDCQQLFDKVNVLSNEEYKNACIDIYNAKRTFIAGASGVATFGALALWASTLGNLGGYIIVSKAVSLLASIGIHIGGAAVGTSTVAALGGPVVWGIGLATILGFAIFALLGGGWKKQFAKAICNEMNKQKALEDFKNANNTYWNDTVKAFEAGADAVENGWIDQLNNLRQNIENYDPIEINARKRRATELKKVIEEIPID